MLESTPRTSEQLAGPGWSRQGKEYERQQEAAKRLLGELPAVVPLMLALHDGLSLWLEASASRDEREAEAGVCLRWQLWGQQRACSTADVDVVASQAAGERSMPDPWRA